MDRCSLHPLDPAVVRRYADALIGADMDLPPRQQPWAGQAMEEARRGYAAARHGDESGANLVSQGLGRFLAAAHPSFLGDGVAPTVLEARIDRGVGMLLRPPARLFGDAGLETVAVRAMPIRLDLGHGRMGGAHVPARLVPDLERLIEARTVRLLRRLAEAELDAVPTLGLLIQACAYARERGFGLYEAMDVFAPWTPGGSPPGAELVWADRANLEPALRRQLEEAAKPPKRPSLLRRIFGRRPVEASVSDNGHLPGQID